MERRKQFYTDQTIQGYLLAGFIAIELLLVGLMMWLMYAEVSDIIDDHLFRVHPAQHGAWPELFSVLAMVLGSFLIINLLVLYLAHHTWSRYVNKTVSHFSSLLDRLSERDFDGPDVKAERPHPVAGLMEVWYQKEKARNQGIVALLEQLSEFEQSDLPANDRQAIRGIVSEYRQLLKVAEFCSVD